VLLQAAARYEDYSDFGSTTIGKLAGRWSVSDSFTLRAAGSTGFHAPTPGQSNLRTTNTTFDGMTGLQVEELQVAPTDPLAVANGGKALTEEKSVNYSVGFTADFGESTTLTVDAYQIEVSDRIYRTGDIAVVDPDVSSISFYTNAMDLEHKGLDVVLTSGWNWSDSANTDITLAYNHNEVEVTDQQVVNTPTGPVIPVSDANVEDIENNFPEDRFVLTANTYFGSGWNLLLRANYYGDHYDERGRIGADVEPSAKINEIVYIDLELGWDVSDNIRLVAGGSNIFDEYVDEIGPPNANRLSVGLPYPRRSAANYEGGSWYLRAAYRW
jgi:iron complex outermembrane receptor protein